ncbi:MAG: response regulator, partial [Acidobacteria bacterium]|nr:response regulator [Acidobacteriota bacterium]
TDAIGVFSQRRNEVAVVLTDLAMPYMDGTALIRALKKMQPELPIVAMSGLMSEEQTTEFKGLNVSAFLSKPFTAETLLTTLRQLLDDRG